MDDRRMAMVLGAFCGDSLALGAHWDYNPSRIERVAGRVTELIDPVPSAVKWHPARKAGQFTHYGDQMLVLLRSLRARGGQFDSADFGGRWRSMWDGYDGYVDQATRETLERGAGSGSNDLAGASRIAPLVAFLADEERSTILDAACTQTALTHDEPHVVESAAFFADVALSLLGGASVPEALEQALSSAGETLREWAEKARSQLGCPAVEAIGELGQTCHVPEAFPATVFLMLNRPDDLEAALIDNVMAGGDSAARGMLIGMALGAARGMAGIPGRWLAKMEARDEIERLLSAEGAERPEGGKLVFRNAAGEELAGRLEMPALEQRVRGCALFAHCFTCSKEIAAASRISRDLARRGIAVLRFDFTGLGNSEGDFSNTNFSSNVEDLVFAAKHLRHLIDAPAILIGHSLGGAAVLAAAGIIADVRGVVTIAAPAEPEHVERLLADAKEEIDTTGEAEVLLAGRRFRIKKQFLEDIRAQGEHLERLAELRASLLVMHSPVDQSVGIDNARRIFAAAKHPKSFVSLDPADHLLSKKEDSEYVAEIVSAWASRILD